MLRKFKQAQRGFQFLKKAFCLYLSFSLIFLPSLTYSQTLPLLNLPQPGAMIHLSPIYVPVLLKGMTIHPEDPLRFDFIVDSGNTNSSKEDIQEESQRLLKYFLAALTVPEGDLWVNLSPYEKERMIPEELGKTEMGRDLLAQDYLLKQLTASLIYPETDLGKDFWDRVYQQAQEKFGTTQIPINTFNKVWILPDKATVFEKGGAAYVVQSRLKVMLDRDYLALEESQKSDVSPSWPSQLAGQGGHKSQEEVSQLSSEIIREVIIPEIEREVNEGKNFAPLRQIYHSLILAKWYKETIKESLLHQVYVNQNKIVGVDVYDKTVKEKIYRQYLAAFKQGVFNYIKEDYDKAQETLIPRKYFSGGISPLMNVELERTSNPAAITPAIGKNFKLEVEADPQVGEKADLAVLTGEEESKVLNQLRERVEAGGWQGGYDRFIDWVRESFLPQIVKLREEGYDFDVEIDQSDLDSWQKLPYDGGANQYGGEVWYYKGIHPDDPSFSPNSVPPDSRERIQIIKGQELEGKKDKAILTEIRVSWNILRLNSNDPQVRANAALKLGELGSQRAVEPLLKRLEDDDSDVLRAAAEALGKLGDKRAVEPLLKRLEDDDRDVRQAAAAALTKLGDKRAVEVLNKLRAQIPEGKTYSKEDKVNEFFPIALAFREEGYDFQINYQSEEGHLHLGIQEKGHFEGERIGGLSYGDPGYGDPYEGRIWVVDGYQTVEKWVVDVPEKIGILRGPRLEDKGSSPKDSAMLTGEKNTLNLEGGIVRLMAKVTYIASQASRPDAKIPEPVQGNEKDTKGNTRVINLKPWTIFDIKLNPKAAQPLIDFALLEQKRFAEHRAAWEKMSEEDRKALTANDQWKDLANPGWQGPPRILLVPAEEMGKLSPQTSTTPEGFVLGDNTFALFGEGDRTEFEAGKKDLLDQTNNDQYVRMSAASLVRIIVNIEGKDYYVLQGKEKQLAKNARAHYQPFGGHAFFTQKFLEEKMKEFGIIPENAEDAIEMAFYIRKDRLVGFLDLYHQERLTGEWKYFKDPAQVLVGELIEEIAGQSLDGTPTTDGLKLLPPATFQVKTAKDLAMLTQNEKDMIRHEIIRKIAASTTKFHLITDEHIQKAFELFKTDGDFWASYLEEEGHLENGTWVVDQAEEISIYKLPGISGTRPAGKDEAILTVGVRPGFAQRLRQGEHAVPLRIKGEEQFTLPPRVRLAGIWGSSKLRRLSLGMTIYASLMGTMTCISGCGEGGGRRPGSIIEEEDDDVTRWDNDRLIAALDDPVWEIQRDAAIELFRRGHEEGVALARDKLVWPRIESLTDADPTTVFSPPYQELVQLGEIAIDPLIENLQDKDAETDTRKWSARLLGRIGQFEQVFDILVSVLEDTTAFYEWWHQTEAENGIFELFIRQSIEFVEPFLQDENERIRRAAVRAIAEIGEEAADDILVEVLKTNSSGFARAQAARSLRDLVNDENHAVIEEVLINALLHDLVEEVRTNAAFALGAVGTERAVDALVFALLNDSGILVRDYAAYALGQIGDPRAVEPLIQALLHDSSFLVRNTAADSLGVLGDTRAVEPLMTVLANDPDEFVRSSAAEALGEIADPRAVDALNNALLNDQSEFVRESAALALGEIGDARGVDALIKALRDPSHLVRLAAVAALGEIADARAVDGLIEVLLRDPEEDVRNFAAFALGQIGNIRAVSILIYALRNDTSWLVRRSAAQALGRIGEPAAIPDLEFARDHDPDSNVRAAARAAIAEIQRRQAEGKTDQAILTDSEKTFQIKKGFLVKKSQELLEFIARFRPEIEAESFQPQDATEYNPVILAIGSPSPQTFIKAAEQWKLYSKWWGQNVPIVASTGRGRGYKALVLNTLRYLRENEPELAVKFEEERWRKEEIERAVRMSADDLFKEGGVNVPEKLTEAKVIQFLLVEHGVDPSSIVLEEISNQTQANMQESYKIIKEKILPEIFKDTPKKQLKIQVVTDGFHRLRTFLTAWEIFRDKNKEDWLINSDALYVPRLLQLPDDLLLSYLEVMIGNPKDPDLDPKTQKEIFHGEIGRILGYQLSQHSLSVTEAIAKNWNPQILRVLRAKLLGDFREDEYNEHRRKLQAISFYSEEELSFPKVLGGDAGRTKYQWNPKKRGFLPLPFPGLSVIHNIEKDVSRELKLAEAAQSFKRSLEEAGLGDKIAFVDLESFHATTFDLINEPEHREALQQAGFDYEKVREGVQKAAQEFMRTHAKDPKRQYPQSITAKIVGIGMFSHRVVKLDLEFNEEQLKEFQRFRRDLNKYLLDNVKGYDKIGRDKNWDKKLSGHITFGYVMNKMTNQEIESFIRILRRFNEGFKDIEFPLTLGEVTKFDNMDHYEPLPVGLVLPPPAVDKAMLTKEPASPTDPKNVGGIDLKQIELRKEGEGIDFQFTPNDLEILNNQIDGFVPIIINVIPITNVLPILGLEPVDKREGYEVSSIQ